MIRSLTLRSETTELCHPAIASDSRYSGIEFFHRRTNEMIRPKSFLIGRRYNAHTYPKSRTRHARTSCAWYWDHQFPRPRRKCRWRVASQSYPPNSQAKSCDGENQNVRLDAASNPVFLHFQLYLMTDPAARLNCFKKCDRFKLYLSLIDVHLYHLSISWCILIETQNHYDNNSQGIEHERSPNPAGNRTLPRWPENHYHHHYHYSIFLILII